MSRLLGWCTLHRRRVLAARVRQRTARRKTVDGRFEVVIAAGFARLRVRSSTGRDAEAEKTERRRFKPAEFKRAGSAFLSSQSSETTQKGNRPQFSSASSNPLNDDRCRPSIARGRRQALPDALSTQHRSLATLVLPSPLRSAARGAEGVPKVCANLVQSVGPVSTLDIEMARSGSLEGVHKSASNTDPSR